MFCIWLYSSWALYWFYGQWSSVEVIVLVRIGDLTKIDIWRTTPRPEEGSLPSRHSLLGQHNKGSPTLVVQGFTGLLCLRGTCQMDWDRWPVGWGQPTTSCWSLLQGPGPRYTSLPWALWGVSHDCNHDDLGHTLALLLSLDPLVESQRPRRTIPNP